MNRLTLSRNETFRKQFFKGVWMALAAAAVIAVSLVLIAMFAYLGYKNGWP